MKISPLICSFTFLLCSPILGASLLQPNDRLAICGSGYSIYLEDYLLASDPTPGLDIANFDGRAGDPRLFLPGLESDLLPFKPTVVLTYLGGDAKAQTDAIESLKRNGVRTIVVGSLPCVDSVGFQNDPVKAAAENKTRAALADITKDVAAKEGEVYADVYGTTMTAMLKAKVLHGDGFILETASGEAFSLAVTSAFLKALGCSGDIGTLTIDFAAGKAEGSPSQRILSYKDNTLKVESTRLPFQFPGHGVGGGDLPPWPILNCLTFDQDLNRYILIVKNLPSAQAKVYWGDDNRDYSSDELARGVNLQAAMPGWWNPFGGLFASVDNGVRDQHGVENLSSIALAQGKADPQADAKRQAALRTAKARFVPPQSTIRIQPLAEPEKWPSGPIPVIVDTDMVTDVDDVGALALLNSFMIRGEANLLACVHDTADRDLSACATIQAINAYYGHPSIPIGQSYGEKGPSAPMTSVLLPAPAAGYHEPPGPMAGSYTKKVHQRFDPDFPNDDKIPAGVDVYRKALASAPDGKVVICSIGTMENLQDLIQSQPDSVSNLSGLDLVRKKVRELVIMANTLPQDGYLLSKWPTKIVWTTYVGTYISAGPSLIPTPESNPVRAAYQYFGDDQHNALKEGRQSWDLTAAWLAVRGVGNVWDVVAGRPASVNEITHSPAGPYPNECEVTVRMPYPEVSKLIGDELARPPKP